MQQHEKFITGLALLDAMKNLDTELYSSTEKDKHITGLLEYFGQDKIEPVCKKMELLQDRIDIHLGYAEVHKQQWEKFEQMKK